MSKEKNIYWQLPVIFAISILLFYPSLNYYFFQDDWFVLNWIRTQDIASFFEFRTDIIYWRPISMPIFFLIGKTLFNLNSFGYHLLAFFVFFLLVIAVYHLFNNLFNNQKVAILIAFLYATWPIHFISLSWLSTTSYIIGPLFQIISFIFFIKFVKEKNVIKWIISFLFFILALASSEFTIVLPIILAFWGFLIVKRNVLTSITPYIFISLLYFLVRFVITPIPSSGTYQLYFNHLVIDNLLWYLGWAINLPDSFKDLIDQSFAIESVRRLIQYWRITVPVMLFIIIIAKLILSTTRKNLPLYIFGIAWLIIGLSPVLFLIEHSYSMYLSFAGLGLLFIVATSLLKTNKVWWLIISIIWLISSFANLQFTRATHWIINESAISYAYTDFTTKLIPNPDKPSVFIIKNPDISFAEINNFRVVTSEENVKQALNDDDALQVIFNNSSINSQYNNEQTTIPEEGAVYTLYPNIQKYNELYKLK